MKLDLATPDGLRKAVGALGWVYTSERIAEFVRQRNDLRALIDRWLESKPGSEEDLEAQLLLSENYELRHDGARAIKLE
jgi:hypothetical protein